ncbi:unnamed protein product, partial [Polarella glacialis]
DHTGKWAPDLDFDAERSAFEAQDFRWDKFRPPEPQPASPYVAMEFVPGRTLHAALGWSREQPLPEGDGMLSDQEKKAIVKQAAEALGYLSLLGLIHRDFRTTNLMVSGGGSGIRVRAIDMGHTILAQPKQARNKSTVVRCNWKEDEKKLFDWAPPEVKAKDHFVNFAFPTHAFDVYSLAVLMLQLETGSLQNARAAVGHLLGSE